MFGPKSFLNDNPKPCPACDKTFVIGDYTALIELGPGDDLEEQKKALAGRAYNAVAVEVHWSCATGQA